MPSLPREASTMNEDMSLYAGWHLDIETAQLGLPNAHELVIWL
jgi:hypothetical protein